MLGLIGQEAENGRHPGLKKSEFNSTRVIIPDPFPGHIRVKISISEIQLVIFLVFGRAWCPPCRALVVTGTGAGIGFKLRLGVVPPSGWGLWGSPQIDLDVFSAAFF